MIRLRGKNVNARGKQVNDIVEKLNTYYSTNEVIDLWFVEDEYSRMTDYGPDYGHAVINGDQYHIFVAVKREAQKIAGIIAMQYGLYLEHFLKLEEDIEEAVTFAKFVTGLSEKQPTRLLAEYGKHLSR